MAKPPASELGQTPELTIGQKHPITPSEIFEARAVAPDVVIDVFNGLLLERQGKEGGCFFRLHDINTLLKERGTSMMDSDGLYPNLDWVIDIGVRYGKAGWTVKFTPPDYRRDGFTDNPGFTFIPKH